MSSAYNIKKINSGSDDEGFVTVLKYAVVEEKKKKYLVPLFFNNTNKPLDSLVFNIEEYNEDGKLIAKNKAALEKIAVEPKSVFGGDIKIKLSAACADVKIVIVSGGYGKFLRVNEASGVVLSYKKQDKRYSDKEICELTDGKRYDKQQLYKSNFIPALIVSLVAILILSVSFFCYVKQFAATENSFIHGGCVYSFIDKDDAKTVRLVGTNGYKNTVVIPEYIGEYKVTEIASFSFENERFITEIVIKGSPKIHASAFSDFSSLQMIDLGKVTDIGDNAFYNCSNLREVCSPYLKSIGSNAFSSCTSLISVQLADNETVTLGARPFSYCDSLRSFVCTGELKINGSNDIFRDCSLMEILTLKELPAGAVVMDDLFGYAKPNLVELTLDKLDVISESFCTDYSYLEKVTIGKLGSGDIGNNAFFGCSALSELNVDIPFTSVGKNSFRNTRIPYFDGEKIETVGEYAFAYNTELTEFDFNEKVKVVPTGLFEGCSALGRVSLSKECTQIGDRAFKGCSELEELIIPDAVKEIGSEILSGCKSIKQLTTPFLGGAINNIDTLEYFFKDRNKLNVVPASLKKVTVKSGDIVDRAFYDCTEIENIIISGNINAIGEKTFYNCRKLKSIVLPVTINRIGENAFDSCYSLTSIILPNALNEIGDDAFKDCFHLYKVYNNSSLGITEGDVANGGVGANALFVAESGEVIPYGVHDGLDFMRSRSNDLYLIGYNGNDTVVTLPSQGVINGYFVEGGYIIADYAFAFSDNCKNIKGLAIDGGVVKIGKNAFNSCSGLSKVTFSACSIESVGEYAFALCPELKEISFSNDASIDVLGDSAFADCGKLEKISFNGKSHITQIGNSAFVGCNLKGSLAFPAGLKSIGDSAFKFCSGITSVTFPVGVTSIGDGAFSGCNQMTSVLFSATITSLGGSAFGDCASLTSLSLPSRLSTLGDGVFAGCLAVTKVEYSGRISSMGQNVFENCSSLESVKFSFKNMTLPDYTFSGCRALKSLNISGITGIGTSAFADCESLEEFDIPSDVAYINSDAFLNCSSLELIYLPKNLSSIGIDAFSGCTNLYEIYNLPGLSLNLGDSLYGEVAKYAYVIHSDRSESKMPKAKTENITFIKPNKTWLLVKYRLPGDRLTLANFDINGTKIDKYAIIDYLFANSSVREVTFGAAVESIGKGIFSNSMNLQKVSFASNSKISEIPAEAFSWCSLLTKVEFPNSVEVIGDAAFVSCNLSETEKLSSSLKTIGDNAFSNTSIKCVYLPESLSSIGDNAFANCSNLYEVYNLSKLYITAGSGGNGGVALNAIVVNNDEKTPRLTIVNYGEFRFFELNGKWYLHGGDYYYGIIILPETFESDGKEIKSYIIWKKAYSDCENVKIVIPSTVSEIQSGAFASKIDTIYYEGTAEELSKLLKSVSVNNKYYYADCVHEQGQWTYDSYGEIDTIVKIFVFKQEIKPTCTEDGKKIYECPYCKKTKEEPGSKATGHSYNKNGVCTKCGGKKAKSRKNAVKPENYYLPEEKQKAPVRRGSGKTMKERG